MRSLYLPACIALLACGGDATAVSTPPPVRFVGTYRGTAQGSENGALFNGVISTFAMTADTAGVFAGSWTVGANAGTLVATPLSGSPGYFTLALTQTAPCPGPAGHLDGWGVASLRASDQQVMTIDVYYGGPNCLGTPLPATAFLKVTLALQ